MLAELIWISIIRIATIIIVSQFSSSCVAEVVEPKSTVIAFYLLLSGEVYKSLKFKSKPELISTINSEELLKFWITISLWCSLFEEIRSISLFRLSVSKRWFIRSTNQSQWLVLFIYLQQLFHLKLNLLLQLLIIDSYFESSGRQ